MKNDAAATVASGLPLAGSLPMHPMQSAPIYDSCIVPVNVCNSQSMTGGWGMGGMYGMNGMHAMQGMASGMGAGLSMNGLAMNTAPMNAYNGMGLSGYGAMPLMNMYGR